MGGILRMTPRKKTAEAGLSLIEVLVSMALLGMLIYFAQSHLRLNLKFQKQTTDKHDLIEISHDIERRINCGKINPSCPAGSFMTLYDKSTPPKELIRADQTSVFKGWNIAAECTDNNLFIIRGAKFLNKKLDKDGLTGKELDWKDKNGILFNEGMLCGSNAVAKVQAPDLSVLIIAGVSCTVNLITDLPCEPPPPPDCLEGYNSTGVTIDTFGGSNPAVIKDIYGMRWLRYCVKAIP